MTKEMVRDKGLNRVPMTLGERAMHILLAEDGSMDVAAAVELIQDLSLSRDTKIIVMSVIAPADKPNYKVRQDTLDQTTDLLKKLYINIIPIIEYGDPAEKLLEYALQHTPNLIVLGANGLRQALGIPLGGAAQKVIEQVRSPVMVMRHPYRRVNRVLLLTDGSSQSQYASQYLAEFPIPTSIEIEVLHVLPPISYDQAIAQSWEKDPKSSDINYEPEDDAAISKAMKILKVHNRNAKAVLIRGDPINEIMRYIKDRGIDLTVAGARGLTKGKKWELGSISRKLVHFCGCSMLIVKDRRDWSTRN